ncbi:hypothetical protein ACO0LM_11955 [Undibacterium sp. Di26W]|uniref:hypothetical protein n=1 Tax=Undibacterium sp. Di26W TaxID=3413035 RepID=UPI003BEFA4A7
MLVAENPAVKKAVPVPTSESPSTILKASDAHSVVALNLLANLHFHSGNPTGKMFYDQVSGQFLDWLQASDMESLKKPEPTFEITSEMAFCDVALSFLADIHLQTNLHDTDEHDRYMSLHRQFYNVRKNCRVPCSF